MARFARLLIAAIMVLAPVAARADWAGTTAYPTSDTTFVWTKYHDWTTTLTATSALDTRLCSVLSYEFDPSTGDSSTDARVMMLLCNETQSNCERIVEPSQSGTRGTMNASGRYLVAAPITGTSGGDTARIFVSCLASDGVRQCLDVATADADYDDERLYLPAPNGVTLAAVMAITDTGTATVQMEERSPLTPTTAGTSLLTSSLTADTDGDFTTSFAQPRIGVGRIGTVRMSDAAGAVRTVAYCKAN